jgi:ElaB/YqjD/DUF883 family membrane-anchored ribosome-binding protein
VTPLAAVTDDLGKLRKHVTTMSDFLGEGNRIQAEWSEASKSWKQCNKDIVKLNEEVERLNEKLSTVMESVNRSFAHVKQELDEQITGVKEAKKALEGVKEKAAAVDASIDKIPLKELSEKFASINSKISSKLQNVDLEMTASDFQLASGKAKILKAALDSCDGASFASTFATMAEKYKKLYTDVHSAADRMDECEFMAVKNQMKNVAKEADKCQDVMRDAGQNMTEHVTKVKEKLDQYIKDKVQNEMEEVKKHLIAKRGIFAKNSDDHEDALKQSTAIVKDFRGQVTGIKEMVEDLLVKTDKEFGKLKTEVQQMNDLEITKTIKRIESKAYQTGYGVYASITAIVGGIVTTVITRANVPE